MRIETTCDVGGTLSHDLVTVMMCGKVDSRQASLLWSETNDSNEDYPQGKMLRMSSL